MANAAEIHCWYFCTVMAAADVQKRRQLLPGCQSWCNRASHAANCIGTDAAQARPSTHRLLSSGGSERRNLGSSMCQEG